MYFSGYWRKDTCLGKAGFLCNRTWRERMCVQTTYTCFLPLTAGLTWRLSQQVNRTQVMLTKVCLFPDSGCGKGKSGRKTGRGLPFCVLIGALTFPLTFSPVWHRADDGIRAGNGLMLLWNSKGEENITLTQTTFTPVEQVWINLSSAPAIICYCDRMA